jgi:predicted GIY-YIG superfamily endonuclease
MLRPEPGDKSVARVCLTLARAGENTLYVVITHDPATRPDKLRAMVVAHFSRSPNVTELHSVEILPAMSLTMTRKRQCPAY